MKALSIRQPWAWLIGAGFKDIENRDWQTQFRGRIYIHTGKKADHQGFWQLWRSELCLSLPDYAQIQIANLTPFWEQSAIIGEVDVVDCVTSSDSMWFVGKYGLVLANPVLYEEPILCKGKLGFFEPDFKLIDKEA